MLTSPLLLWLGNTLPPLGALWLMYRLALRRERCFGYNRGLLLLAPVLAATLPLLPHPALPAWLAGGSAPGAALPPLPTLVLPAAAPVAAGGPDWSWVAWVYAAGVGLLLGRLAGQGWRLHRATRCLPREARPGYWLACTGGQLPTSSFGRTVFWDETAGLTPAEAAPVLAHELAHVRQGHSYDVLWLKIWRAVLWPNPFAHLLLPALRLTHELLADRAATPGPAPAAAPYPALLARLALRGAAAGRYAALLQPFTFSFTLTRIAMLQNQNPVRRWKQWLALPVLGGLFLVACQKMDEPTGRAQISSVPDEATQKARSEIIDRKIREAKRQDLLRNGKVQPGTAQYFSTNSLDDKPENITVTITRIKKSSLSLPQLTASGEQIYTFVEQMPHLPNSNGMEPIIQQIQDNFTYPAGPRQEGRIFATFTVLADGSVGNTKIIKGLAPAFDAAVLAAIQQLPRFEPGKQSGKAVAVSFTVPISVKN